MWCWWNDGGDNGMMVVRVFFKTKIQIKKSFLGFENEYKTILKLS